MADINEKWQPIKSIKSDIVSKLTGHQGRPYQARGPIWIEALLPGPLSGVSTNFWGASTSDNHRNHELCEKARPEKGNAKLGMSGAYSSVSFLQQRIPCPWKGHFCNTQ